jgi:hypothetical protein
MPEPGLRPSTGVTRLLRYHEPLRLPRRPETDRFRSPRLAGANPSTDVDLARCLEHLVHMPTPIPRLERAGSPVGCSAAPPTAFPLCQEGRLQQGTIEACSEFTRFGLRTCTLVAPGTSPEASAGQLLTSTAPVATGRTDNSPDGTCTRWSSRPRRSRHQLILLSSRETSLRAALPSESLNVADLRSAPAAPK